MFDCVEFYLQTFMPVQQLSGVVHSVQNKTENTATHQTVEENGEEFTLHQAKGVPGYLPDQYKTCKGA